MDVIAAYRAIGWCRRLLWRRVSFLLSLAAVSSASPTSKQSLTLQRHFVNGIATTCIQ